MIGLFANSGDPDQMAHSVASDLGQHYLPVTFLGRQTTKGYRLCVCMTAKHSRFSGSCKLEESNQNLKIM